MTVSGHPHGHWIPSCVRIGVILKQCTAHSEYMIPVEIDETSNIHFLTWHHLLCCAKIYDDVARNINTISDKDFDLQNPLISPAMFVLPEVLDPKYPWDVAQNLGTPTELLAWWCLPPGKNASYMANSSIHCQQICHNLICWLNSSFTIGKVDRDFFVTAVWEKFSMGDQVWMTG